MDLKKECETLWGRTEGRGVERDYTTTGRLRVAFRPDCRLCGRPFSDLVKPSVDRLICLRGDEPYSWARKNNFEFLCWPCNQQKGAEDQYERALYWARTMRVITDKLVSCKDTSPATIDFEAIKADFRHQAKSLGIDTEHKFCSSCKTYRELKFFKLKNRIPHFFDLHYDYFYETKCALCHYEAKQGKTCDVCKTPICLSKTELGAYVGVFQRMCYPDMLVAKEHAIHKKRPDRYMHRRCQPRTVKEDAAWAKVDAMMPSLQTQYAAMMNAWNAATPRARELSLEDPRYELYVMEENFARAESHRELCVNTSWDDFFLRDVTKKLWLTMGKASELHCLFKPSLDAIMKFAGKGDYIQRINGIIELKRMKETTKRCLTHKSEPPSKRPKLEGVFDWTSS